MSRARSKRDPLRRVCFKPLTRKQEITQAIAKAKEAARIVAAARERFNAAAVLAMAYPNQATIADLVERAVKIVPLAIDESFWTHEAIRKTFERPAKRRR